MTTNLDTAREFVKIVVKRGLATLGFELRRLPATALPAPLYDDPMEAISRINAGELAAIRGSLKDCVMYNGLSLGQQGWHPFVEAARCYLKTGNEAASRAVLDVFYSKWQPINALEALIGARIGPQLLARFPPHLMHAPWITASPDERMKFTERNVEVESLSITGQLLTIKDGYGLHGPVSREKAELEHKRLINIVRSIRKVGYDRTLGDVTAQVLRRGDEYRYRLMHGHHRASALVALGHNSIPVVPTMLVDREDVEHWPQVYRGIWSRDEALAYFDHHFDFDSGSWAHAIGLVKESPMKSFP